ncbi:MAG: hypothetical protein KDB03_02895 [Planctomycetales bacterium]|nr:hypothetical protein [Planctomycetales bacterium]
MKRIIATLSLCISLLTFSVAPAAIVYDSLGFEGFAVGALAGQSGGSPSLTWNNAANAAVATVQSAIVKDGTRAAALPGNGDRWVGPIVDYTPLASETVLVEVDIRRSIGILPSDASEQYSIDIYSSFNSDHTIAFGLFNDGGTLHPVVYTRYNTGTQAFDPSQAPADFVFSGVNLQPNTWVSFRAELNYNTKMMDLTVNGQNLGGAFAIPFADLGAGTFYEADLEAVSALGTSDVGYYDNYRISTVSAVPEPGFAGLLTLACVGLMRRRRK